MRRARGRGRQAESAVLDPDHPPAIPDVVGLTRIGGGKNSTVYRGTEQGMQRAVAVKVLHTPERDADGRRAFEDECALAGRVGAHQYAAKLFRKGFADDFPFIVMDYYTQGSLADQLKKERLFELHQVLGIGINIACALQFAHDLNILHRDIKPANILSDGFGNSVLADFGIAAARDMATRQVQYSMTPAYAAPEVIEQGGGWPSSDVWSLAATLYALLAGHPPFFGAADLAGAGPRSNLQALAGPLPAIRRADVPGHVHETLARALIGRPDLRTGSARRLAEELNADQQLLGIPLTPLIFRPADPGPSSGRRAAVPRQGSPGSPGQPAGPGRAVAAFGAPPGDSRRGDARPGDAQPGGSLVDTGTVEPGHGYLPPAGQAGYGDSRGRGAPYAAGAAAGPGAAASQAAAGNGMAAYDPLTVTGMVNPGFSYAVEQPQAQPAQRRTLLIALLAVGGTVLVAAVVAGALSVLGHKAASTGGGPASPGATASATPPGGASAPPPPEDVTAVPMGTSAVRISWKDSTPGPHQVIISLGSGHEPRVVHGGSPQVISRLTPAAPYCFAVGYVYTVGGKVSYSTPACINGGTPSAGG